jgi:hypothetical protein
MAKQKAAAEAQRKAEAELQAQLAAEQSQARAQSALSQYIPYIQDKVNRAWIRPQGSREGLVCGQVSLIPEAKWQAQPSSRAWRSDSIARWKPRCKGIAVAVAAGPGPVHAFHHPKFNPGR